MAVSTQGETDRPQRSVEELTPERIRWFYKNNADKWQALNGRDSLVIEAAYRRHRAALKAGKEGGATEADGADRGRWAERAVALGDTFGLAYDDGDASKSDGHSQRRGRPPKCPYRLRPLYWKGSQMPLVRGTWFLDTGSEWTPLDANSPELVQRIEEQHVKMFAGRSVDDQPGQVTPIGGAVRVLCELLDEQEQREACTGVRVCWSGRDDIRLYNYGHSSRWWRLLRTPTGAKLTRGYATDAKMDDGQPPVTDLVLVVHGIGQKYRRHRIIHKTATIRNTADDLLKTHFPDRRTRPLFLPVDWRTELKLDDDMIENLTPSNLEDFRSCMNNSVLDLLYYASPIHGQKIVQLCATSSTESTTFSSRTIQNSRKGVVGVSILAHSLGAVLTFDILSANGRGGIQEGPKDRLSIESRADASSTRLKFQVHHLFCVGCVSGRPTDQRPLHSLSARRRPFLPPSQHLPPWRSRRVSNGTSDFGTVRRCGPSSSTPRRRSRSDAVRRNAHCKFATQIERVQSIRA